MTTILITRTERDLILDQLWRICGSDPTGELDLGPSVALNAREAA